jgi:glycosidase
MAVILDWVANHTSWDNPWITNVTWYTRNSSGAIVIPPGTNWQDVADLDYSNAAMKRAMYNAMKYWVLAANVDGYRCDYADGVPFEFWKAAIDTLRKIPNRKLIMLAEGARADHFFAGFNLNYGWGFFAALKEVYNNSLTASGLYNANSVEQPLNPVDSYRLRFTANHDEVAWDDTPLGLFEGKAGSIAAFVISTYMAGVPLIYNGQEVGCAVKLPFFSRSPIDWSTNPDMVAAYKKIIHFRNSSIAARQGYITGTYSVDDPVIFKRTYNNEDILVIVNARNYPVIFPLEAMIANTNWINALTNSPVSLGSTMTLQPFEYLILKE